jgi:hypothetical protein
MSISRLAPNTSVILRSTQTISTVGDVLMAALLWATDLHGLRPLNITMRLARDLSLELDDDGDGCTLEELRLLAAQLHPHNPQAADMFAQSMSPLACVVAAAA